jgi:hypothetical protein
MLISLLTYSIVRQQTNTGRRLVIGANLFGKKEFALDDLDSQEAAPAAATQAQKPRKTKIAVALAAGAIGYAIVSAGQVSTDETDLDLAQVTYPTMR